MYCRNGCVFKLWCYYWTQQQQQQPFRESNVAKVLTGRSLQDGSCAIQGSFSDSQISQNFFSFISSLELLINEIIFPLRTAADYNHSEWRETKFSRGAWRGREGSMRCSIKDSAQTTFGSAITVPVDEHFPLWPKGFQVHRRILIFNCVRRRRTMCMALWLSRGNCLSF